MATQDGERPGAAPDAPAGEHGEPGTPSLADAMRRAGQLMVLLERHLDRAAGQGGELGGQEIEELGRAWVRASQLEQLLRGQLPPGATDRIDVNDPDAAQAPEAAPPG
jgi:hypothetical protein